MLKKLIFIKALTGRGVPKEQAEQFYATFEKHIKNKKDAKEFSQQDIVNIFKDLGLSGGQIDQALKMLPEFIKKEEDILKQTLDKNKNKK